MFLVYNNGKLKTFTLKKRVNQSLENQVENGAEIIGKGYGKLNTKLGVILQSLIKIKKF